MPALYQIIGHSIGIARLELEMKIKKIWKSLEKFLRRGPGMATVPEQGKRGGAHM
jgi:hypothetical protein